MRKVIIGAMVPLDGVMQAPGGPNEDPAMGFNYAFGKTDVFIIADLPDNISATALSLAVNASGAATTKVTVFLMTGNG